MGSAPPATNPVTTGFTEEGFKAFVRERDDPAWLVDRRREAFARLQAFAFPSARDEEWRRTDIRGLKIDAFAPPQTEEPAALDRQAFENLWKTSSAHYATGIAHIAGALARQADASLLGRAIWPVSAQIELALEAVCAGFAVSCCEVQDIELVRTLYADDPATQRIQVQLEHRPQGLASLCIHARRAGLSASRLCNNAMDVCPLNSASMVRKQEKLVVP